MKLRTRASPVSVPTPAKFAETNRIKRASTDIVPAPAKPAPTNI
jgi:hypothetical protein